MQARFQLAHARLDADAGIAGLAFGFASCLGCDAGDVLPVSPLPFAVEGSDVLLRGRINPQQPSARDARLSAPPCAAGSIAKRRVQSSSPIR